MINKNGFNTVTQLIDALTSIENVTLPTFGIATSSRVALTNDISAIKKNNIDSPIASGYVFSKDTSRNPQQYQKLDNSYLIYDGELYSEKQKNKFLTKKFSQNLFEFAQKLIIKGTEPFVFCISKKNQLLLGRDPIGIQPFYYGENKTHFIFATNRRVLWKLKINNPKFFPPGHLCNANKSGLKFNSIIQFENYIPKSVNMKNASKSLLHFLDQSISKKVKNLEKCAIAFSGGIDSSLIAFLVKKYVKKVQLIHVSIANKQETNYAEKVAKILDLPIKIFQYAESEVEEIISKVLWVIEESNPLKVSIGIPFYWTAEKAKQMGFNVLLAGQGADELFGGYKRYLDLYLSEDKKTTKNQIYADIINIHENNLSRDMKICDFHGITLFCPFLSTKLVDFALRLPVELKLEKKTRSLRKRVLRQAGYDVGLSSLIVNKPKKAIQYSTGVNNVLKRIAKREKKTLSKYINYKFKNQ